MSALPQKAIIPPLTGYRAVAAWMIFVYHFFPFQSPAFPQWSKHLAIEFRMGIDLFFVLSGFLITYRYFGSKPFNFRNYIVNRFARIYPVHLLLTGITYLLIFKDGSWNTDKTVELILNLTLTKALFKEYIFTGIAQGWTLTMEEIFYFSAPFFFIFLRKSKWYLFIIPITIFLAYYGVKQVSVHYGFFGGFMQVNIAKYIFDFFIGIGLALLLKSGKPVNLPKFKFTWFGVLMVGLYIIIRSFIREDIDTTNDFVRSSELTLLSLFGIAPLIWGLIHEKTWLSKLLSTKTFLLLGKSSYVFYLIHWSFASTILQVYISKNPIILFILLNIISILIYLYFEKPFNTFVKKVFTKKNSA